MGSMPRLAVTLACALAAAACGGSGAPVRAASSTTKTTPPVPASSAPVGSSPSPSLPPARRRRMAPRRKGPRRKGPPPGSLPQTRALPGPRTPAFRAEMRALWRGVTDGAVRPALPAFVPRAAYVRLKRVADPAGDWRNRLVGGYALDIAAAHALLGAGAARARLLGVEVPQRYAHWVPPGVCANGIGYWEVPNARVVYRAASGAVRSFGIASMISWRGVWYVVHLGAVLPPARGGAVDDPSAGPGTSAYSGTC